MAIHLKSSQDLAIQNGVKILVYGKAGFGKTSLVATAPTPLLISAESGLLSLREENLNRMFGEDNPDVTYNIPVIEVTTLEQLIEAYNWCCTNPDAKQFETICLDSITEIAEKILANAKLQVKDPRQAYGELIEKMIDTIKKFRDIKGFHVYMSCKQEFAKDEASGTTSYVPSMPGSKLGQQIPYLFDEVFNLNIGKLEDGTDYRYLRTQPDFQYEAKDRSGSLEMIEMPDLTYIINKINGVS
jgi:energy-coupling factor transporter ATP-binding protein EcfA2